MSTFLGYSSALIPAQSTIQARDILTGVLSGFGWQIVRQSLAPTSVLGNATNPGNALDMVASSYATGSVTATVPIWVGFNLAAGFTPVNMYLQTDTTVSGWQSTTAPLLFTLDYSSNGSTWTTLQTFNQTAWTYFERRKFAITGATSQTYWRISVVMPSWGAAMSIGDWVLEDASGRWVTTNVFFDCIPPVTETIGNSFARECMRWSFPAAGTSIVINGVQESLAAQPAMWCPTNATAGAVNLVLGMTSQASGGTASFASNIMTLQTVPTTGSVVVGSLVQAVGVAAGTYITSLASGTLNGVGSTYTLSTSPGTVATEAFNTTLGSTGGTASFATNVMTLQTAPTQGTFGIGSNIFFPAITVNNCFITGLASGTWGAVGSTYTLSMSPGTIPTCPLVTSNGGDSGFGAATPNGGGNWGGSASFSGSVMTITAAPTGGFVAPGQTLFLYGTAQQLPANTSVLSLASGTWNAIGSTYNLSTVPGTIAAQAFGGITGTMVNYAGLAPNTSQQNARGLYEACKTSTLAPFLAYQWIWPTETTGTFGVGQFMGIQATPTAGSNYPVQSWYSTKYLKSLAVAPGIVQGNQYPVVRSITIDLAFNGGFIYYLQVNARGIALATKTNVTSYAPIHACYMDNDSALSQLPVADLAPYGIPCTLAELCWGWSDQATYTGGYAYFTHVWGVGNVWVTNAHLLPLESNAYNSTNALTHHQIPLQVGDHAMNAIATQGLGNGTCSAALVGEGIFQGGDSGTSWNIHRLGLCGGSGWNYNGDTYSATYCRWALPSSGPLDWYRFTGTAPANEQILIAPHTDFTTTVATTTTKVATSIVVDSTAGFPASGWIFIEGEIISYSGLSGGNTFTGCVRGLYNTIPVTPIATAPVNICGWWVVFSPSLLFAGFQTPT